MEAVQTQAEGLADLLRARTHFLHARAEKSGIIRALIQGRASRAGYALLLRNLLPAYEQLEAGLERHRESAALRRLADPAVYRSRALVSDLEGLCGPDWSQSLPRLPVARHYAHRISDASAGEGVRLLAHAYTRYLGDLNGGRILKRVLAGSLGLGPDALSFYAYPEIADLDGFRRRYRDAFDAVAGLVDAEWIAEEARVAFQLNIELSEAVQRAATAGNAVPQGDSVR